MLIDQAFNPENFRKFGHEMVDLLADFLQKNSASNNTEKAIPFHTPDAELDFWQKKGLDPEDSTAWIFDLLDRSVRLHNPHYMGHQVAAPAPVTAGIAMLTSLLNNGMAVYEMGMVSNALERIISKHIAVKFGFSEEHCGGLMTSGGSLANLTALLAARAKFTKVWGEGTHEKLAIMVSSQAHYCIDRAARIMGLGTEGILQVPVNEKFQLNVKELDTTYEKAQSKGLQVIAIVGSACSTATGSYDNLLELGNFAQKKNLWFHVDGAHGAAVVFSEKYRHLIHGIELADSITLDWHKMLLSPALTTSLLFKNDLDAYRTFQQEASYLWSDQQSMDWYNSGKRAFECTKLMMSVKVYSLFKTYGESIFNEHVSYTYDLAQTFAQKVKDHRSFELFTWPQSNIVCFKHKLVENSLLRQKALENGDFYIVQTQLNGEIYLRVSLMNSKSTEKDLDELLAWLEVQALSLNL